MSTQTGLTFKKNYENDLVETKRTHAPNYQFLNAKSKYIWREWCE